MNAYELIEHTADMGVRAWGEDREALFQQVALGMYAIALERIPETGNTRLEFTFQAETNEMLLMLFLEELVYLLYTRNLAAPQFSFDFKMQNKLLLQGGFETILPEDFKQEIKSPTYHLLKVEKQTEGWMAEVYFDL
jgi:protein archease